MAPTATTGGRSAAPSIDPTTVLMATGPLGWAGGVIVFDGLPPASQSAKLLHEAWEIHGIAQRQFGDPSYLGPPRARTPRRALTSGPGGPLQDRWYADPGLHAFIGEHVGVAVVPSGNRGSYTFYEQPGDRLDLHVDVYDCDVTLITALYDDTHPAGTSGAVVVYRSAIGQPLQAVGRHAGSVVKVRPGQSMLILGGLVPHRVLPLDGPGRRIISPLCFRAVLS